MLTPFDDYPVHQVPLPIAHAATGDPNHYDRYWFNGFTEDRYFAVAMGRYPNRGVMDAAFAVVHDGVQRSVFVSGRAPVDPAVTAIGPVRIEVVEPLRTSRIVVDAPEHGLAADLTFTARTAAFEEPRQTHHRGTRLFMDATRMTQWGSWTGTLEVEGRPVEIVAGMRGTKDRSWGIRPVGAPAAAAPAPTDPQFFFLWAPLHFDDTCLHFLVFEDADGHRWAQTAAMLQVIGPDGPTWGPEAAFEVLAGGDHDVRWATGLRRAGSADLHLRRRDGERIDVALEPTLTFRMRGAGYTHPRFGHGHWHDELVVAGEQHSVEELDSLDPSSIHVQQVMRATWGERTGLGVLEQLVFGRHESSGFQDLLDGAP
ncbi:MAG: hypothetical protein ACR2HP_04165 [Ilumatobacteraceae bacterium]